MKIAQVVAGYSLGRADNLRRAMGKKKLEVMEAEKPAFIEGAVKNGFDKKLVEKLWDKLVLFANYGFNKAHSASYATTAYRTAYLKTHYPLQYMAALLEGDLEKFDRVIIDLKECERLGIQVLPPDINLSGFYFQTENDNAIRFGLGGIKNLGHDIVKNIVSERETNGKFQHLDDFVHRTFDKVNKKAVEYLIMSGAMDSFGNRFNLLQTLPLVYEKEKNSEKVKNIGQFDFFSLDQSKTENISMTPLVESKDADRNLMLQWERELLGMYFSSYPLDSLKEFFESKGVISISEALENKKSGEDVILGVMVTKLRKITTKKGEIMAFLTIEDKTGSTDAIIFPRVYTELKESLKENIPMLILGRINERGGEKSIVVQKAKYVDERKHSSKFDGVTFKITIGHTEDEVSALKQFIQKSIGDTAVKIVVDDGITSNAVILNKTILVDEECQKWLRVFRS